MGESWGVGERRCEVHNACVTIYASLSSHACTYVSTDLFSCPYVRACIRVLSIAHVCACMYVHT